MEEPNSALVKALIDLDTYKLPQFTPQKNLDYLQLEREANPNLESRFKKAADKTERMNK
jgi:hypothetical protein